MNEEHFAFHLQYKHSGTFANRKCEELSFPQKIRKYTCDPILAIQLKMRPHYSQPSRENAAPSSDGGLKGLRQHLRTFNFRYIGKCSEIRREYLEVAGTFPEISVTTR